MKYGGQGGWRAVKRLNRDARIADGSSPYGYRARYDRAGKSSRSDSMSNGEAIGCAIALAVFVLMLVFMVAAALFQQTGIWGFLAIAFGAVFVWQFGRYQERVASEAGAEAKETGAVPSTLLAVDHQCTATTRRGLRCKKAAVREGRCALHLPRTPEQTAGSAPATRGALESDLFLADGHQQPKEQASPPSASRAAVEGDIFPGLPQHPGSKT